MLRQVLVPDKENATVSIPAEFYGRKIEVLFYPFNDTSVDVDGIFDKYLFPMSDFTFDREEANNYE